MGLVDRLRNAGRELFRPMNTNTLTTSQELDYWLRLSGGASTVSGEPVTATTSTKLTTVGRCVRLLSQSMGSLPLPLMRIGPDGRKSAAKDDPLYRLLHDQPNEWQTSHQWRALKQRDLELRGNAYSLIVRGTGRRIQELIRLHPDRVKPEQDQKTLAVTYRYTRPDGGEVVFPRDHILHIWFESDDGIKGLSPIAMHRETIGDALALQRHGSRFFAGGAKPLGVINMVDGAKIGSETQKAFREDWEKEYAGGANAHKTLLLPFGLKYEPVKISMADAQYIEGRKFSVSEIARIFGVPAHMAGDLERATFTNVEHQRIEFVQDAIVGRAHGWEQCIHRDLLDGDPDLFVKFNVDGLLRGDFKSRQEGLQIQRRNGIINADEWRDIEDKNAREDAGGQVYIIEGNMQPNDGKEGGRNQQGGALESTAAALRSAVLAISDAAQDIHASADRIRN